MAIILVKGRKPRVSTSDGHGMSTPGKRSPSFPSGSGLKSETGNFMHENEFNRRVEDLLHVELKRCGFDVIKCAPTDVDVPLPDRAKVSNSFGADLHIDIHANAFDSKWDKDGHGIEVLHSGTSKSKAASEVLLKHLLAGSPQKNRGIKLGEKFYMLSAAVKAPSVIIEAGFMDDIDEIKLLLSESYRKEVAVELAKGTCEIFDVKYVEAATASKVAMTKPATSKVLPKPGIFKDVSADDSLNKTLQTLKDEGLMHGYADGTFRPSEPLTRRQFAIVIERLLRRARQ